MAKRSIEKKIIPKDRKQMKKNQLQNAKGIKKDKITRPRKGQKEKDVVTDTEEVQDAKVFL
jgi:hypothetical protein